ncbi:MAG: CpaF family protein [Rhodospirillales bacterium]
MGFGRRDKSTVVALSAHRPPPGADDGAVSARTEPEGADEYRSDVVERVVERTWPNVKGGAKDLLSPDYSRGDRAACIGVILDAELNMSGEPLFEAERRDVITQLLNRLMALPAAASEEDKVAAADPAVLAKERVQPLLMERMDVSKAAEMPRAEMATQTSDLVAEILAEEKFHLNLIEQRDLVTMLLNDMLGLGPLEPLLADERVTDIMVNGPDQVFVERGGRLELAEVRFRDNAHVLNVAQRIVSAIGRRVDETSPLCDARLADGSRVNVIIPPLAIDGPSISIRKFAKQKITMEKMEQQDNLSSAMATVLRIAGRSRLNIIISGGTGSGKTTLLNALSRMIDPGERIVTIEDAAELQLQQPHVVRLETRPANLEGEGEITQRDLVKNCLRMRPDRIILGEIRAGEALDMLQAMNTGHDGSLCTIHANRPREALTRLENMVAMAGVKLPNEAVRSQIAGAVNMIVQIARMRDGVRRITHITEVVGMEGEVVTTQDLFTFQFEGENADGTLYGSFKSSGLRPNFAANAKYFGLEKALLDAVSQPDHSTRREG